MARNTDAQVETCIRANFPGWSPIDTDTRKVGGVSLREALKTDIYRWRAGQSVRGKHYFRFMKQRFAGAADPCILLKAKPNQAAPRRECVKVVVDLGGNRLSRQTALDFCGTTNINITQREFIGLAKTIAGLKLVGHQENSNVALAFMELIARGRA